MTRASRGWYEGQAASFGNRKVRQGRKAAMGQTGHKGGPTSAQLRPRDSSTQRSGHFSGFSLNTSRHQGLMGSTEFLCTVSFWNIILLTLNYPQLRKQDPSEKGLTDSNEGRVLWCEGPSVKRLKASTLHISRVAVKINPDHYLFITTWVFLLALPGWAPLSSSDALSALLCSLLPFMDSLLK